MGNAYFLHFDLVPTLNRVVVVSPDFAATESVIAPIDTRWVRCPVLRNSVSFWEYSENSVT